MPCCVSFLVAATILSLLLQVLDSTQEPAVGVAGRPSNLRNPGRCSRQQQHVQRGRRCSRNGSRWCWCSGWGFNCRPAGNWGPECCACSSSTGGGQQQGGPAAGGCAAEPAGWPPEPQLSTSAGGQQRRVWADISCGGKHCHACYGCVWWGPSPPPPAPRNPPPAVACRTFSQQQRWRWRWWGSPRAHQQQHQYCRARHALGL